MTKLNIHYYLKNVNEVTLLLNILLNHDLTYRALVEPPRKYLGASSLGVPCSRALQYEYIKAINGDRKPFGEAYRIRNFEIGHLFERLMIDWLKRSGFKLITTDAAGKQLGFEAAGGKIAGHIDGIIIEVPSDMEDLARRKKGLKISCPMLWETKSMNNKSWRETFKKGLVLSNPVKDDIKAYCFVVFSYLAGLAPLRSFAEKGGGNKPPSCFWIDTDDTAVDKLFDFAEFANRKKAGCYVIPAVVEEVGQARSSDIKQMQVLLIDLDEGDIESKLALLENALGEATLIVESGGVTSDGQAKLHVYWQLIRAVSGEKLQKLLQLRHKIALSVVLAVMSALNRHINLLGLQARFITNTAILSLSKSGHIAVWSMSLRS